MNFRNPRRQTVQPPGKLEGRGPVDHPRARESRRATGIRPCLLLLCLTACSSEPEDLPPDIVMIMMDTTRADQLEPFAAHKGASTPFLNRLAVESLVFRNAWTASTHTCPSTASVFTGLLPPRHGVEQNLLAMAKEPMKEGQAIEEFVSEVELIGLPSAVPTITQHLSKAGYQTLGIGSNINFCAALGFSRGFDLFSEHVNRDAVEMETELYRLSKELRKDRPTFTYLHFMDAHSPYGQRKPWCPHEKKSKECSPLCRYRSEISFLDQKLGEIFEHMGWLENTIVIVVTDHGEEFHEHGDIMHRFSVHTELSRAGLMIKVPGVEPRMVSVPAHHTDLLPTILDIAGLPAAETTDGIALLPSLDKLESFDRALLTCRVRGDGEEHLWGLTWRQWRLLVSTPSGKEELFDFASDPDEQKDLILERPDIAAQLRTRLAEARASLIPIPRETVAVELSQEASQELLRLGYAGGNEKE